MQNKVSQSIEAPGGALCVDIFRRPDGTWGFEEYRRDSEDGSGWFTVGFTGDQRFASESEALSAAIHEVEWLSDAMPRTTHDKG